MGTRPTLDLISLTPLQRVACLECPVSSWTQVEGQFCCHQVRDYSTELWSPMERWICKSPFHIAQWKYSGQTFSGAQFLRLNFQGMQSGFSHFLTYPSILRWNDILLVLRFAGSSAWDQMFSILLLNSSKLKLDVNCHQTAAQYIGGLGCVACLWRVTLNYGFSWLLCNIAPSWHLAELYLLLDISLHRAFTTPWINSLPSHCY